ncbi:ABC transporter ATP-binding protein [Paenibacillus sp. V4I5]|uniref:ABC transporter ATP-binding protein n=1 Tax=Paenibacillus sp. V4I5 TaxID=3042306 RepID=UPI00278CD5A0|nr:ABC transporter ATP-binding protein [Paenibacillus sp. V4I5]MDQ0917616.1 ABC-type polysaccharide/polyol phosphate transport system ATPase subunit [Paenibacillus sp. V4I5]
MSNEIIRVSNVSKKYKMYKHPTDRLKEALSFRNKSYHRDFRALDNINFSISRGENVGIIGKNGSGKSTLLKIITGIVQPSTGNVQVYGRVSAILELGAGFNPEYSGIENIYTYGMIMGITKREMQTKIDEIIEFADLGSFINQPVKTYSSGMYARLAFSVAINIDPDLLIVDEALSVGDMGFQHKCMNKMKELIDRGVTVIFVSHDTFAVKSLCSRCIYLEHGNIKADGSAIEVTDIYLMDTRKKIYTVESKEITSMNKLALHNLETGEISGTMEADIIKQEEEAKEDDTNKYEQLRYGTGDVRIKKVSMINEQGKVADHFEFGEMMSIEIDLQAYKQIDNLNCCIRIRDKNGIDVTGTTTIEENITFPTINEREKIKVLFKAPNLLKHDMTFSLGATINDTKNIADQTILDHVDLAYTFKSVYNPKRPVWYMYYQEYDIKYDISK